MNNLFFKKRKITLIGLIIGIGLLAGLAIPKFIVVVRDAKVTALYRDIDTLETAIIMYHTEYDSYPVEEGTITPPDDVLGCIMAEGNDGSQ